MTHSRERSALTRAALRVAWVYAAFAGLWILLSDRALGLVIADPQTLVWASVIKGWFFVAVTTLLLFVLVRRLISRLDASHQRERQEAQEKGRTVQLLAAIAKSSSDAIYAKDTEGRYLLINDAALRYMGKAMDAVLGQDDLAIFPSEQAQRIQATDRRVLASGRSETSEERLMTAQGERVFQATKGPLRDFDGRVIGVFGISRDITDRMQTEHALRESEERLRLALAAASQGMFDLNLLTGEATVSPEYARMLGEDPQGFHETLQSWSERLHPEDRPHVLAELQRFLAGGNPAYRVEFRLRTRDGRWKWILSLGQIEQRAVGGKPLRMLGTHTDIDAIKSAEAELREINATLETRVAERTAELSTANRELETFAYAVSHDLRAPLRAINGYAQALQEDFGGSLPQPAQVYLERIHQSTAKMGELIEGLLALSRSSRGELRHDRVDVSALARQRLAQLAEESPRQVVVEIEVEEGLEVVGDERMLSCALTNLIDNAWKYTGATAAPVIRVHAGEVAGLPGFCVSDNGAGFDMSRAERLFQPFQRLHRDDQFPGIGIGLATVQRIVQRHGGEIKVHAQPGQGACFCVGLPMLDAGSPGSGAAQ